MDRRSWAGGLIFLRGATLKAVATVRGLLPPTLFTHLGAPVRSMGLPMRVAGLIVVRKKTASA